MNINTNTHLLLITTPNFLYLHPLYPVYPLKSITQYFYWTTTTTTTNHSLLTSTSYYLMSLKKMKWKITERPSTSGVMLCRRRKRLSVSSPISSDDLGVLTLLRK